MKNTLSVTIGWLYPDLMSTYGDRGNILVLKKRLTWRDITVNILPITHDTSLSAVKSIDLLFGGGAQDREQDIVMKDLKGKKGDIIHNLVEEGVPALFVCGAPQLMGKSYEPAVGKRIEGLGIFDMETVNPGPDSPRLIGNVVASIHWEHLQNVALSSEWGEWQSSEPVSGTRMGFYRTIVGFENHGGRSYLGKHAKPFARVVKGNGNNNEDGTEGVIYKNAVGCYFHGPLLPKNPIIADWLLTVALEKKYQQKVTLKPCDDGMEEEAHHAIAKKLEVSI